VVTAGFTTDAAADTVCLFSPDSGIVIFTDASTNATARIWYFGDGDTSIMQNPTHDYTAAGVGSYTVKLVVWDSSGLCKDSITSTIIVDSCITIGINELINFNSLILSPNPTTGELNVSFDVNEFKPSSIEIYNVIGELITEISNTNGLLKGHYNFDLSNQPNGAYFVKIKSDGGVVTKKVNIIR